MTSANGEMTTLRFSTAEFSGPSATDEFVEIFGRTILRLEIERLPFHELEAEMSLRSFCGVGMASGALSPMRNHHPESLIDNDDLVLVYIYDGLGVLDQRGKSYEVRSGQVALTDNGVAGIFTGYSLRAVNLRFSRARLAPQIADLDRALLAPIVVDSPALRLLASCASSLSNEALLATPELRWAVAAHMHDLAALAIGATDDAAEIARDRGLRAARLHGIKSHIVQHLTDASLSAESVALAHGISPRYVRMLFERDGTSFSEFVLGQRLQRAHRLVLDPRFAAHTISGIAFDCGFSDLSYFNRTFRRRYGASPSDIRQAALKRDG